MKMSPEYVKAQANMRPGVITSDGFLGEDKRPITDIIAHDEERMAAAGLDWSGVATKMRHLLQEGMKGLGEPVTIEGTWLVETSEARGFLASPFEDGIYRKVNAVVELIDDGQPTGEKLLYSDLSLHLLEKYHFLQGHGSPFRLEPEQIKKVLKA